MTTQQFHDIWDAERQRMLDRGRAFCEELRRQEDLIREILPAIRQAFRMRRGAAPGANDNTKTTH